MSTTNYFSGAKGVTLNGVEIKHIEGNSTTYSTNTHHNNSTKNFNIDASQNQQTTNYNNSGEGSQTVLNGGSTYNDQRGGFQPPPVYPSPLPPFNSNLAPTGHGYPWQPPYTAYRPTQPPTQAPTPQHQPPTTPFPPSDETDSGGSVNP